jgi:hypothetical protein
MLAEWARDWAVPAAAMADLQLRLGMLDTVAPEAACGQSEAAVQTRVRLHASRLGFRAWRNNVGAGYSEDGQFMRWGLANDSAQVNRVIKSADLIGCRPFVVQQQDVGRLVGRFVSYEIKHAGWKYAGTEREIAQANWAALVCSLGGDARFITSEHQL